MQFTPDAWRRSIYVNGFGGKHPIVPTRFDALEDKAKGYLSDEAWRYINGGAGMGATMINNRKSFDQYQIIPRMLRNVADRNLETTLFGQRMLYPILTAPIGVLELVHSKADLNVAAACKELNIPMIFSSQASQPMEKCAAMLGDTPGWFQLYWSKSEELVRSFVKRAEQSNCKAIVVTLDTFMLGWRPDDLDIGFLPFMKAMGIAQYTTDPVFQELMNDVDVNENAGGEGLWFNRLTGFMQMIKNYKGKGSFLQLWRSKRPIAAVRKFIEIFSNPALTWSDLAFLKSITKLPILLKGILHPGDAQLALEHGVQGIIVSNHGGRQVGGSISAMEALPMVVKTIDGKIPVMMDSGIRSGDDIFKALALGASAVCVGRPYVYGMAIDGAQGVAAVLKNLITELDMTMGLSGCKNISEINAAMITKINQ